MPPTSCTTRGRVPILTTTIEHLVPGIPDETELVVRAAELLPRDKLKTIPVARLRAWPLGLLILGADLAKR